LALPENIRLVWKNLPVANALSYYKNYSRKKFYNIGQQFQLENEFDEIPI
jgi:hypothetical protein